MAVYIYISYLFSLCFCMSMSSACVCVCSYVYTLECIRVCSLLHVCVSMYVCVSVCAHVCPCTGCAVTWPPEVPGTVIGDGCHYPAGVLLTVAELGLSQCQCLCEHGRSWAGTDTAQGVR